MPVTVTPLEVLASLTPPALASQQHATRSMTTVSPGGSRRRAETVSTII